ncbi:hypothetical protein CIPAW_06G018100 [Carya illinoinensis]|uniref:Uncharacterized protein n=1 Tax=Carya illinoinensis TaxID=32201 RepID=A0A8T1PZT8_CARIL|nr:hypothetical protein CIPAW_06G018100 [Carya illinoinensis]
MVLNITRKLNLPCDYMLINERNISKHIFFQSKLTFLSSRLHTKRHSLQLDSSYYQDHLWKSKDSNLLTQPRSSLVSSPFLVRMLHPQIYMETRMNINERNFYPFTCTAHIPQKRIKKMRREWSRQQDQSKPSVR